MACSLGSGSSCPQNAGDASSGLGAAGGQQGGLEHLFGALGGSGSSGGGEIIGVLLKLISQLGQQTNSGPGQQAPSNIGEDGKAMHGDDYAKKLFGGYSQSWDSGPQRSVAGMNVMLMDTLNSPGGKGFF